MAEGVKRKHGKTRKLTNAASLPWGRFLSSTIPSSAIAWVNVGPRDPRQIKGCVAASDNDESDLDHLRRSVAPSSARVAVDVTQSDSAVVAKIVTREPEVDDNEDALVGRVYHTGAGYVYERSPFTIIPGSVLNGSVISIPWGLAEYKYDSFELLTIEVPFQNALSINAECGKSLNGIHWSKCRRGAIPKYAVKGGLSEDGELLYIGRNSGSLVDGRNALGDRFPAQTPPRRLIGKVHSRFGRLYIAFRGVEYFYDEYEVLALNQSPASLQVLCRNLILRCCASSSSSSSSSSSPPDIYSLPLPTKLLTFLSRALPPSPVAQITPIELESQPGTLASKNTHDCDVVDDSAVVDELGHLIELSAITEKADDRLNLDASFSSSSSSSSESSDDDDDDDISAIDNNMAVHTEKRDNGVEEGEWTSQFFPSISWNHDC